MGASGVGKSTLCSLFGDFPLSARHDKSLDRMLIENA